MDIPNSLPARPLLKIRPRSGWQALDLREIWRYRDLLFTFAVRDVKLRYRQTALGALWVVLQPLMAAGIFSFVFGRVAKMDSDGVPYFVFSYAGLLGWNAFNSTLTKASSSLVGNVHLVSKVYFPRLILPLSTVFSSLIDFLVALVVMGVLLAAASIAPTPALLLLPVWLLLLLCLAVGVGLHAASLMVTYRDVQYVLPVLTQFLLYASPVAYSVSRIPESMRTFYFLNPVSGLLEAFRWSLLHRTPFPGTSVAYAAAVSVLMLVWGAFVFRKKERGFADVI